MKRDATQKEIKKAYRKLALQWHPDKHVLLFERAVRCRRRTKTLLSRSSRRSRRRMKCFRTKVGAWDGVDCREASGV